MRWELESNPIGTAAEIAAGMETLYAGRLNYGLGIISQDGDYKRYCANYVELIASWKSKADDNIY